MSSCWWDDLAALPKGGLAGGYLPEHKKIREELRILLPALEPEDELVIGLAGHGVQFKDDNDPYFCPLDADLGDKSTLISLNWLYKQLKFNTATKGGGRAKHGVQARKERAAAATGGAVTECVASVTQDATRAAWR